MNFTLLIPVYNTPSNLLRECLSSVVKQFTGRDNFKCLIIDDGSKDRSGTICDEFAKKYPSIFSVIHQENHGPCYSRNLAIRKAKSDYIMFLDCDDTIENGYCDNIEYAVEKYKDSPAIHFNMFLQDISQNKTPCLVDNRIICEEKPIRFEDRNRGTWYIWSYIFKKQFLLDHNITFPEHLTLTLETGEPVFVGEDKFFMVLLYNYTIVQGMVWFGVTHRFREDSLGKREARNENLKNHFKEILYKAAREELEKRGERNIKI